MEKLKPILSRLDYNDEPVVGWRAYIFSFFITLFIFSLFLFTSFALADEFDDLTKQINDLQRSLEMSQAATVPLEVTLKDLDGQIAAIRAHIAKLAKDLEQKEADVAEGEKAFALKQQVLEHRVRSVYKNAYYSACSWCGLLGSADMMSAVRLFGYQKSLVDEDKDMIAEIVIYIKDLEEKKKQLELESARLASAKVQVDKQAEFYRKEIKGARDYQAQLGQKIAELSARQQAILAERTGLFATSVGDVPLADDPASRPDYDPGFRPAFAAFSFGAPHFRGMSQYGALGRSKDGQNYEQILRTYYGDVRIDSVDTGFSIATTVGSLPFEDNYLKGIAEMPTKWADEGGYEALKAQAIAARSYALAYTGWRMGDRSVKSTICITEQCQVYNSGKAGGPGRWGDAVNDTKGKILVSNQSGEVVNAWYASTSGGYQESYSSLGHSTPGLWDTKNGRDGWTSQAYEKLAGSPWFYKGWYKSRSGVTCGRSHPWLTKEEFADIVNAAVVYQGGGDMSGVFPPDVQSCYGGSDQPWSRDRLKQEADRHGGGFTSVSSVSVQYSTSGITARVIIDGREFDGEKFFKAFNLRAPGAVHLKSGLFNIEKK